MLRFVVGPERRLVFDVAGSLPGRGMWLKPDPAVLAQALKRGVFARAAKQPLVLPADLAAEVKAALLRRFAELLGLARRGGGAVAGFEKAREWLVAGKAQLIVQAADGSASECARFLGGRDVKVAAVLSAAALGQVFGRDQAVHVAIAPGRLAAMLENEAARLQGCDPSDMKRQRFASEGESPP
jgi:predicted RNA-binding protein YlxR (DUF448 family)